VVGVELQSVVKDLAVSNSHWVGSNRMERVDEGDDEGKTGGGRQYGSQGERSRGLYVGDASVMPVAVNRNVHSTCMVVGWKLSEIIQGRELEWSQATATQQLQPSNCNPATATLTLTEN